MRHTYALILAAGLGTLCCKSGLVLGADEAKPSHFKLSEETINRIPVIGEVVLSDTKRPLELNTGSCFVGITRGLVVHLRNDLLTKVTIERVKTSCGCTAAYPAEGPVQKGGSSNLLLTLRIGKPGSFRTKLTLETSAGEFVIFVTGKASPQFEIPRDAIRYSAERKGFIVELQLNDPSIANDHSSLFMNGTELPVVKESNLPNRSAFLIEERMVSSNAMTAVIPRIGDQEGSPILLPLQIPGKLTLTQDVIYTNGERLYVIFQGDINDQDFQSLAVKIDGTSYPMSVTPIIRGAKAICVCAIQGYEFQDFQVIRFLLDDKSFDAKVFLR